MSEVEQGAQDAEAQGPVEETLRLEPGKIPVLSIEGKPLRQIGLPDVFRTAIRPDVIKRAVLAAQSARLQPQGRDPLAGKRTTAKSRGVGLGIARVPRVKGSGYPKAGQAAFAPGTVGGRLAHPPKAEKNILKRINKKERRLALKSSLAACARLDLVVKRGHRAQNLKWVPLVVEDELEKLTSVKPVLKLLHSLGLGEELRRVKEGVKIRAGKGKMRGRRYKRRKGPLIVVSHDGGVGKAAGNIPGVEVIEVRSLNAELLAPGAHPGRLTVWSESAIKSLEAL